MALHDFVFNEDLDTNAAIAQIAAALGQKHCNLPDADTIQLPDEQGMYLKRIRTMDETAGGLAGYLHFVGKGAERKFRFGQLVEIGDHLINTIEFKDGEFPLSPGQKIKCFANISGGGAEQHAYILTIFIPSIVEPPLYTGPVEHMHMLEAMSGTLTANTLSGLNSVLGDETALSDSEIQFATDKRYVLKGYWATPGGGAGYSVLGMRHPTGEIDRLSPVSIAAITIPPFVKLDWEFKGKAPVRIVGSGVGTTTSGLTMLLGEID